MNSSANTCIISDSENYKEEPLKRNDPELIHFDYP